MRKLNLLASISIAALTATAVVGAQAQVTNDEVIAFQMAMNQGDLDGMMEFLRNYPTSPFAQAVVDEVVDTVGSQAAADMISGAQSGSSPASMY